MSTVKKRRKSRAVRRRRAKQAAVNAIEYVLKEQYRKSHKRCPDRRSLRQKAQRLFHKFQREHNPAHSPRL